MSKAKQAKRRRAGANKRLSKGANRGVLVLLVQSVEHLGDPGDIVEVKPGYANNYLIPQGLATVATEHHKRMVEKHRARLLAIQQARLASLRSLAKQLAQLSLSIEAHANDEGHLYGSVGPHEIVKALKAQGVTSVAADQVRLEGPLKELGLYTVKVHLGHDVDAEVKVWVVPPSLPEEAPAPPDSAS